MTVPTIALAPDLVVSARRIAWGKFVNAGQTCVAPDYVLVPESLHDAFVAELVAAVTTFFGADRSKSADYGRIVNARHHARREAERKSFCRRHRSRRLRQSNKTLCSIPRNRPSRRRAI